MSSTLCLGHVLGHLTLTHFRLGLFRFSASTHTRLANPQFCRAPQGSNVCNHLLRLAALPSCYVTISLQVVSEYRKVEK